MGELARAVLYEALVFLFYELLAGSDFSPNLFLLSDSLAFYDLQRPLGSFQDGPALLSCTSWGKTAQFPYISSG
jgi:hypothetical protein